MGVSKNWAKRLSNHEKMAGAFFAVVCTWSAINDKIYMQGGCAELRTDRKTFKGENERWYQHLHW